LLIVLLFSRLSLLGSHLRRL